MKRSLLVLLLCFSCAFAEEYTVFKKTAPLNIDGKLDEADWAKAAKAEAKDIEYGTSYNKESWFKMLYDDDNLYFGAYFEEQDVKAEVPRDAKEPRRYTENKHDPDFARFIMFHDSFSEIFIDPDADGHGYIEMHINASGKLNDWWIKEPKKTKDGLDLSPSNYHLEWDCLGAKCAAFTDGTLNDSKDSDKGWSFELAVPVRSIAKMFKRGMGKSIGGEKISVLLVRTDKAGKQDYYLSWPVVGELNCHRPDKFGTLVFSDK
jgi:hypothetical protein